MFFVGEEDEAPLLYTPTKVVAVYDYALERQFVAGVDYAVEGKKIKRLRGGSLPFMAKEDYFLPAYEKYEIRVNENAIPQGMSAPRFFAYGEGDTFTKRQIAIVYEYGERENLPAPTGKRERFSRFLQKCEK